MRTVLCLSAIALLSTGCVVNPYASNYTQVADPSMIAAARIPDAAAAPRLVPGSNPQTDVPEMYAQGYVGMGYSRFSGKLSSGTLALEHAKQIGADVVLVYEPSYQHTQSGAVPISLPTQTTYTGSSTATAYNSYGSTQAYGSTTGNISGQQWALIPYSVDHYSHLAAYFVRVATPLGLHLRLPSELESQMAGTQRAVVVEAVVRGSEAFRADILPGDIILAADGVSVDQIQSAASFAASRKGKTVDVELVRGGQRVTKKMAIP